MNFQVLHKEIDKALEICEQFFNRNVTEQELKDLRKKCGVPESGTHYNTSTMRAYNRLANTGFKDEDWNPASGQADRLKALKGKNWKDGYLMVRNGEVMYPYIDRSGTPQVSGVRAAAQRAGQQGETTVSDTASKVLDLVNKHKDEGNDD